MNKILITGSKGFIGRNLVKYLLDKYNVTELNRTILDLSDANLTKEFFKNKYFDAVIHCAISGGSRLKQDDLSVYDNNIKMFNNLMDNKNHFNKFINFTSGAEFNYSKNNYYGQSKRYITNKLKYIKNSYNLRIYACFGTDELDTRFIKSSLIKYINKKNIIINKNKKMDFFYIKDLVSIIKYIIEIGTPLKEIDLCYNEKYYLIEIAEYINKLNLNYNVNIFVQDTNIEEEYIGKECLLPINWIGLKNGIKEIYEELKNGKN